MRSADGFETFGRIYMSVKYPQRCVDVCVSMKTNSVGFAGVLARPSWHNPSYAYRHELSPSTSCSTDRSSVTVDPIVSRSIRTPHRLQWLPYAQREGKKDPFPPSLQSNSVSGTSHASVHPANEMFPPTAKKGGVNGVGLTGGGGGLGGSKRLCTTRSERGDTRGIGTNLEWRLRRTFPQ